MQHADSGNPQVGICSLDTYDGTCWHRFLGLIAGKLPVSRILLPFGLLSGGFAV
jgi:hypothetical protein